MDALVAVRRHIAEALIDDERAGPDDGNARLGEIRLHAHQVDAVRRLLVALRTHGGALLADAPGLGKTYVALAVARTYGGAVVVGPAALRSQWARSAAAAGVPIAWASVETLSRRPLASQAPLLIADEAHHLRNPRTRRYAHAAALAAGKQVLLLSATPVHNRTSDRDALLALFLGASAARMDAAALARMIVRRTGDPLALPQRGSVRWLPAPVHQDIAAELRALPPPLPARDGRHAAALLRLTLAHAWSSSVAALDDTLRRLLLKSAAIADALAAGRWPTRRELRAWITTSHASQLAFPEIAASPVTHGIQGGEAVLAAHLDALHALRRLVAAARSNDADARATRLRIIVARHRDATVVAFSRYAGTIEEMWRVLRFDPGVVAITARGVRSAGGGLTRREVLAQLAKSRAGSARMPLRLVLSTDMLGEGLDLRAASVIVHLDQPWTPARLEQREGRAIRLGSTHSRVVVYAMRPPREAARQLSLARRLQRKRASMAAGTGAGSDREALLALVRPWLNVARGPARLAAVRTAASGWIAVVRDAAGRARLLAWSDGTLLDDDARLLRVLRATVHASAVSASHLNLTAARRAIRAWLRADASASLARAHETRAAAHAAIIHRLDEALRAAPLHERAAVQAQAAVIHDKLARLRGAGAERALARAAQLGDMRAMRAAIDAMDAAAMYQGPAAPRSRLLALLLLVPEAPPSERSKRER